jgi:3-hydroxyisobutyryl-CoA hydrolase
LPVVLLIKALVIFMQKLEELEKRLLDLDTGAESAVRAVIEEFSTDVQTDEDSILNKYWI